MNLQSIFQKEGIKDKKGSQQLISKLAEQMKEKLESRAQFLSHPELPSSQHLLQAYFLMKGTSPRSPPSYLPSKLSQVVGHSIAQGQIILKDPMMLKLTIPKETISVRINPPHSRHHLNHRETSLSVQPLSQKRMDIG